MTASYITSKNWTSKICFFGYRVTYFQLNYHIKEPLVLAFHFLCYAFFVKPTSLTNAHNFLKSCTGDMGTRRTLAKLICSNEKASTTLTRLSKLLLIYFLQIIATWQTSDCVQPEVGLLFSISDVFFLMYCAKKIKTGPVKRETERSGIWERQRVREEEVYTERERVGRRVDRQRGLTEDR